MGTIHRGGGEREQLNVAKCLRKKCFTPLLQAQTFNFYFFK